MKATLFFDGACLGNPGPMGIGALLEADGRTLAQISEKLEGIGTNNVAEYTAILRGMEKAVELGVTDITIRGDSNLVVQQLLGKWRVKEPRLRPLHERLVGLSKQFKTIDIQWVPREQNARADALSMAALKPPAGAVPGAPKREVVGSAPSPREHSILCPKCHKPCTLTMQRFKDGREAIRQECPEHGFVAYAPMVEPFLSLARAS